MAQNDDTGKTSNNSDVIVPLELGTIIVDETQSKLGMEFFDFFYSLWDNYSTYLKDKSYQITISEKPMRGIGTQIIIKIEDQEIFQQILQPRLELIQEIAEYAAQYTAQYLSQYEMIQQELQGEDMSGSGIY